MYLKKAKSKGKVYYKLFDNKGKFKKHIGTAEKILKMKEFYDNHKEERNVGAI